MCPNARTGRYFHSIDPGTALAGIAEQLRSLPAVVVVGWREPPYFIRSYSDNPLLARFGPVCCPRCRRNDGGRGNGGKEDSPHVMPRIHRDGIPLPSPPTIPLLFVRP